MLVGLRMDAVLETEGPRLCRKGTQQGPQSDRTGQHTAHGLQVREVQLLHLLALWPQCLVA